MTWIAVLTVRLVYVVWLFRSVLLFCGYYCFVWLLVVYLFMYYFNVLCVPLEFLCFCSDLLLIGVPLDGLFVVGFVIDCVGCWELRLFSIVMQWISGCLVDVVDWVYVFVDGFDLLLVCVWFMLWLLLWVCCVFVGFCLTRFVLSFWVVCSLLILFLVTCGVNVLFLWYCWLINCLFNSIVMLYYMIGSFGLFVLDLFLLWLYGCACFASCYIVLF